MFDIISHFLSNIVDSFKNIVFKRESANNRASWLTGKIKRPVITNEPKFLTMGQYVFLVLFHFLIHLGIANHALTFEIFVPDLAPSQSLNFFL